MRKDTRTQSQNNSYFLFQEWIAQEMNDQWIGLDKLVVEIQPKATKENLHSIFKAILQKMYDKSSTTGMTREEMNNCLSVYMDALSMIWVHLDFPDRDKNNLLSYYK